MTVGIRAMWAMGVQIVIVTNAAGALNHSYSVRRARRAAGARR